jgi:GNAT superfamily N-acetyltransferase
MDIKIRVTDVADDEARKAILDPLVSYNDVQAGASGHRPLAILICDSQDAVAGGYWGRTYYGWLFTELLFVPESLRGRGIGTDLMARAEKEALARGCHHAWLDTFEFQALPFYERIGYERFGELGNYPVGFSRYFLQKALT